MLNAFRGPACRWDEWTLSNWGHKTVYGFTIVMWKIPKSFSTHKHNETGVNTHSASMRHLNGSLRAVIVLLWRPSWSLFNLRGFLLTWYHWGPSVCECLWVFVQISPPNLVFVTTVQPNLQRRRRGMRSMSSCQITVFQLLTTNMLVRVYKQTLLLSFPVRINYVVNLAVLYLLH